MTIPKWKQLKGADAERDKKYLIEDKDGNQVCDDCGKEIHEIPDDKCSAEQDW